MWNDLRFALRGLRRSPGFALTAILSLALGIGANTAIFSLLYQVVLRSLPVHDPTRLVSVESDDYDFGWSLRDTNASIFSYPMYVALRDNNRVFSGLLARTGSPATLGWRGHTERAQAEVVSGNYFEVLGVRPALGRLLTPADDGPGRPPVIVLGWSYWMTTLGGDRAVLEHGMRVDGQEVSVAGVTSPNFRGIIPGETPDFFAPLSMMKILSPNWNGRDRDVAAYWLNLIGRLKPGVGAGEADAGLLPLFRSIWNDELPQFKGLNADARAKILAKPILVKPSPQGINQMRERWQKSLLVVMVMVALVLLIACANIAGLLIARGTARQREIAVRLALGASAWQIARQLLAESLLVALAGGALGLLAAPNLVGGLLLLLPPDEAGGWLGGRLSLPALLFCVAATLLTVVLFGVAPALRAMHPEVAPALKQQGTGDLSGAPRSRTRQGLAILQISISLLLLIGAGLFCATLVRLSSTDTGFQPEQLLSFSIDPGLSGYSTEKGRQLSIALEDRLAALPGARAVAHSVLRPFGGFAWGSGVRKPNSATEYITSGEDAVTPGYFATLGIPLLAGRDFSPQDREGTPKVVILNETFARTLFGKQNPVGRVVHIGDTDSDAEIVGVARDSKSSTLREKPGRFLYIPYAQGGTQMSALLHQVAFFIRTSRDPQPMMAAVRNTVKQLDANIPVADLMSVQVLVERSIFRDRMIAVLGMALGALAALLAALGLYGALSYSVSRRTREFGIRLALGAVPKTILTVVLGEVGVLALVGIAIALPVAWLLARLVEAQLYGVGAHDPLVFAASTLLVTAVAFLAGLIPALRAMRIEPVRALRYE